MRRQAALVCFLILIGGCFFDVEGKNVKPLDGLLLKAISYQFRERRDLCNESRHPVGRLEVGFTLPAHRAGCRQRIRRGFQRHPDSHVVAQRRGGRRSRPIGR